jgi:KaiC/GvpD/RAD55 family RecA-like ATPase
MEENVVERSDNVTTELEYIEENAGENTVVLPAGRELTAEDTYPLSATEKTRFFVVVGATGSGKTTLVTAIYHAFLAGRFKERYLFAGSKTLAAFEKRAYSIRTISNRGNVDMQRTARGSIDSILHLRLKVCSTGDIENLLFSDFSGEDYGSVSANVIAAKEDFQIVKSASHIVVLLDGDKMKPRKRMAELYNAMNMLKTFVDGGIIQKNAKIIIAISKYDLLDPEDSVLSRFLGDIIAKVEGEIPELKGRCIQLNIASMPNDACELGWGYGVENLIDSLWLDSQHDDVSENNKSELSSQFNLWKERMT